MSLQLEFIGHACFRLWEDGKPTIVMDPYSPKEVLLEDDGTCLDADTVIVSSLTDTAHSNVGFVGGNPRVINALDVTSGNESPRINGEAVVPIATAEAPDHDLHTPMDNAMYAFQAGGLWFAHLGDLGYGLGEEELAPWTGKCDVLMAIVGEKNTVKLDDLEPMTHRISQAHVDRAHALCPAAAGGSGRSRHDPPRCIPQPPFPRSGYLHSPPHGDLPPFQVGGRATDDRCAGTFGLQAHGRAHGIPVLLMCRTLVAR